jgi:hypothetical protein
VSCRLPFWEIDSPMAVMAAVYLHKKVPTLPIQIQSMGNRGLILWDMLCRCWDHDPRKRPAANKVLREVSLLRYTTNFHEIAKTAFYRCTKSQVTESHAFAPRANACESTDR